MDMQKETLFSEVETANSKQLAVLKAYFPQCFDKNGAFIQEKLLEIVKSSDVELSKESYSLNWLGKSYARLLANLPPKTLLTEDKDHNQREENKNSQNLLIKGDNLEVLKHMVNAYAEKVKMIYIDPPYNTGSDGFAYNDERKFTPEQLSELAGIDLDEATRILDFTVKGSSSHSAWLTFIYPRLYIARELLREDGVIFISIDDNEQSQLKVLCDEIFGEMNFISNIANINNPKGRSDDKYIARSHEYILCYKKENVNFLGWEPEENVTKRYNNTDGENKFRYIDLRKTGSNDRRDDRPNLFYYFMYNETTKDFYPTYKEEEKDGYILIKPTREDGSDGNWRWSLDSAREKRHLLEPRYMSVRSKWTIAVKDYLTEDKRVKPTSSWTHKFANSERGTEDLVTLGFNKEVFPNPKPIGLINAILTMIVNNNDLVLDFFAGSGSTAHAVLEHNLITGKMINYISVQLDEECDVGSEAYKSGYKNIFEITKSRIKKASKSILIKNPDYRGDIGFKIFETVNDFRTKDESELTLSNHTFFDDVVLTPEQYDTLLTTWCVYDGSLLTTPIEDVDLDGYKAHLCDGRLYLIAPNFTSAALKALLQKLDSDKDFAPNKVVFYGSNFESAKQMELNEALKSYANKKSIDMDLVVRN
ncbi:site-specific DNA-methyltransferase [Salmonella enterica]|uniref:site-specific DNA-methyltransferase (adenine-specific) n=2 Tax=Salmonella typhi TaxID=90370 RepID=A0A1L4BLS8_SALTI|nr:MULTISPECIES: site-specific DNA-methyltransferase [Enterobacterales]EAM1534078.1 site-specific DNA-methyltransferase [Salmonella enterica]EBV8560933.1 site-specific DNA-methyltransferase [Salmonella enterica subsp. enterica serovar Enteritidis]EBW8034349.1 site-specific DNA-methyltransferase [Salmonella enterica subsp. enterica serovar Albany]ECV6407777.1 site-specific DNA-methyltransferase [Salmonella enterica subsp. enterica serovar Thompson]EDC9061298.1 site-specific DNA-methyltransferas